MWKFVMPRGRLCFDDSTTFSNKAFRCVFAYHPNRAKTTKNTDKNVDFRKRFSREWSVFEMRHFENAPFLVWIDWLKRMCFPEKTIQCGQARENTTSVVKNILLRFRQNEDVNFWKGISVVGASNVLKLLSVIKWNCNKTCNIDGTMVGGEGHILTIMKRMRIQVWIL